MTARQHSLGTVTPIRRDMPAARQVSMFDQDDPDVHAADRCVLLTRIEAQSIAGVLRHARRHCPSPAAVDEAIALLTGGAS